MVGLQFAFARLVCLLIQQASTGYSGLGWEPLGASEGTMVSLNGSARDPLPGPQGTFWDQHLPLLIRGCPLAIQ